MFLKVFEGNQNRDSIVENMVTPKISSDQYRLIPISWHGLPALRMEFVGCYIKGIKRTFSTVKLLFIILPTIF